MKQNVANLLESFGGLALLRFLTRNSPRILMYHRVIDEPFVNGLLPDNFERQIDYIARNFRVVPLEQLLAERAAGLCQPYTLALTFDDAHADFHSNVWPNLCARRLPATLYVPTGFVDGTHWLWPDRLRYILLNSKTARVDLPQLGEFSLARASVIQTWSTLGDHCLSLGEDKRKIFIDYVAERLGVSVPTKAVFPFCAVTWDQLRDMRAQGLDIGSHSVSHPILSQLSESELDYELSYSAQRISNELGVYPKGIGYPNGRLQDIDERVVSAAKRAGYEYGVLAYRVSGYALDDFRIGRVGTVTSFLNFKWRMAGLETAISIKRSLLEY